jgi:hypothetical protein
MVALFRRDPIRWFWRTTCIPVELRPALVAGFGFSGGSGSGGSYATRRRSMRHRAGCTTAPRRSKDDLHRQGRATRCLWPR